ATMKGVAARYPAFDAKRNVPVDLEGRINICRTEQQKAPAFAYENRELLALSAFVARQSRGLPIESKAPRLNPFIDQGRTLFEARQGQLNLACSQCHDDNFGRKLAGIPMPQAHPTGYPVYRLEWQSLGSLQRRLRNCMIGMRAEFYPYGAPGYIALETYLMWRARGMDAENPAVRPETKPPILPVCPSPACSPGHPRLCWDARQSKAWMRGSSPRMTEERHFPISSPRCALARCFRQRQLEDRGLLQRVAEPRAHRRLALLDVMRTALLDHHRHVVARHDHVAGPLAPQLPDRLDRAFGDRLVVAHVGGQRDQLDAVLGGIAGEDHVVVAARGDEDQVARRVTRRVVGPDPREHLVAGLDAVQPRRGVELAHIELRHRRLAPALLQGPGELAAADMHLGV